MISGHRRSGKYLHKSSLVQDTLEQMILSGVAGSLTIILLSGFFIGAVMFCKQGAIHPFGTDHR